MAGSGLRRGGAAFRVGRGDAETAAARCGTPGTTDEGRRPSDRLDALLAEQFDAAQTERETALAALETKVKRLRSLHDKRAAAKAEIVARRADTLLREADGLGWGAPGGDDRIPAADSASPAAPEPAAHSAASDCRPGSAAAEFGAGGGGVLGGGGGFSGGAFGGGAFGGPGELPGRLGAAATPDDFIDWSASPLEGEIVQLGRRGGGDGAERWVRINLGLNVGAGVGVRPDDVFEIRPQVREPFDPDAPPSARVKIEMVTDQYADGKIIPGSLTEGAETARRRPRRAGRERRG